MVPNRKGTYWYLGKRDIDSEVQMGKISGDWSSNSRAKAMVIHKFDYRNFYPTDHAILCL
jgi:hypothetical protein